MSLTPFESGDIENFTIQTTPTTTFISSSTGVTGAVYVYTRRSNAIKDYYVNWSAVDGSPTGSFQEINDIDDVIKFAKLSTTPAQLNQRVSQYLNVVKNQPQSIRNSQKQEVVRLTPGVNLALDMTRKFVTTNVLMPTYNVFGTSFNFAFTNYNSLNFLTASGLPTGSALLYPASGSSAGVGSFVSSSYIPSGAFSFDFWINPRYTIDTETSEFKAGTIFHLSGAYALSLISGSSRDTNGLTDGYRLLLQLSGSAKTQPSTINPASTTGLNFVSNDNCLTRNKWQHVTVRWGTTSYNFGSGSFMVDGIEKGTFYIPSASVAPKQELGVAMPSILTIGNFLECAQNGQSAYFFSDRAQTRFGVPVSGSPFIINPPLSYLDQPNSFNLSHPLNAEVHELKIYNKYLGQSEIASRSLSSAPLDDPNLLFYLPPVFTKESPTRSVDSAQGLGGVLVHPFQCINGTTEHPFNVDMSFDTGGHYMNLENWTRDFVTGNYPRLIQLTGSALVGNTEQLTANQFLYHTGSVRKNSLTILPNDNGKFTPSYYNLLNSLNTSSFVTDKGNTSFSLVSLRNMYPLDSIYDLVPPTSGSGILNTDTQGASIIAALSGFDSTSSLGTLNPQRTPTILQRTQENGSLQVVMFDISNLFYGDRIAPGTFVITDNNVSNSYGKVKITLKDDGTGNLYRANSDGTLAVNNSVGNVFYDHGLVLIKNPSLYWFGENEFSCSFKGERNIHVQKMDLYANALELVSSSNPSWKPSLQASDSIDNFENRYVYITDLYIHDDNLNVIAKTKLASPLLKSASDKFKFTVKFDY